MTFLMKTSETKKFVEVCCEAFLIFKNILLKPSRTYHHFYKNKLFKFPSSEDKVYCCSDVKCEKVKFRSTMPTYDYLYPSLILQ
jgi:hypothetical protein